MTREDVLKRVQDLVEDIHLYFEGDACIELFEAMSQRAADALEDMDDGDGLDEDEDEDEDDDIIKEDEPDEEEKE